MPRTYPFPKYWVNIPVPGESGVEPAAGIRLSGLVPLAFTSDCARLLSVRTETGNAVHKVHNER